jgi:hypothetical protein
MKKLGDYGIAPIKCETRVGGADVRDWLYKVNDILYRHKEDYACPALLHRMMEDLRVVLVDLHNTEVPPIAQRKKDEILHKGKAFYLQMKQLEKDFKWEPADAEDIYKVLRYWVSKFVKAKPNLTLEKAVELLRSSKQVYEDYYMEASQHLSLDQFSTASFLSVQDELKAYINSSLGL